jgi:NAD(P)H-nitrite reductase large subunit
MHIVIIGNGISGITAARHIRKQSDFRITVISKESEYFFSRTALMYVYMGHMKFEHTKPYEDWFWKKNRIELLFDEVKSLDTRQQTLLLKSGGIFSFDQLIIASGSQPNKFGWPGQDLKGVQGLYSKQDLENMQQLTSDAKQAVIVGGGLIGVEMAEMLASRNIKVTFLIREKNFWDGVLPKEEAMMIGSHIRDHHIDLRTETNLVEICILIKMVRLNQ